jgi:ABC-type methionine transport system ATPase subunit
VPDCRIEAPIGHPPPIAGSVYYPPHRNEIAALLASAGGRRHVETALNVVNLADRTKHYAREMSRRAVNSVSRIARAIVSDPKLLLCDEPTGDLDRGSEGEDVQRAAAD